jgi:outer membrane receptor protein involved in Fe transport
LQFLNTQANGGVELGYRNLSLNVQASYTAWGEGETATVMDARLMYVRKALTAFVDCTNLLDYEYVGANLVPMPGRLLRVGIRYHMRWEPGE